MGSSEDSLGIAHILYAILPFLCLADSAASSTIYWNDTSIVYEDPSRWERVDSPFSCPGQDLYCNIHSNSLSCAKRFAALRIHFTTPVSLVRCERGET